MNPVVLSYQCMYSCRKIQSFLGWGLFLWLWVGHCELSAGSIDIVATAEAESDRSAEGANGFGESLDPCIFGPFVPIRSGIVGDEVDFAGNTVEEVKETSSIGGCVVDGIADER